MLCPVQRQQERARSVIICPMAQRLSAKRSSDRPSCLFLCIVGVGKQWQVRSRFKGWIARKNVENVATLGESKRFVQFFFFFAFHSLKDKRDTSKSRMKTLLLLHLLLINALIVLGASSSQWTLDGFLETKSGEKNRASLPLPQALDVDDAYLSQLTSDLKSPKKSLKGKERAMSLVSLLSFRFFLWKKKRLTLWNKGRLRSLLLDEWHCFSTKRCDRINHFENLAASRCQTSLVVLFRTIT